MKERLLSAYFVEGRHVGRAEDLADLAAEIGLDRDDVAALPRRRRVPRGRPRRPGAGACGTASSGVPFFVIDGKYGVSGAQAPETFAQALKQVQDEHAGVAS